jgi:hypothetical protein
LLRKPEKENTRKTYAWEDNIKVDLRETRLKGVNWIHLAQDQDTWSSCGHLNKPLGTIRCGTFLDYLTTCSFSETAPWS